MTKYIENQKKHHWPHPINQEFNEVIRSIIGIYGIGSSEDIELFTRCKDYLLSRISGLIGHKIKRDTEEYYQTLNLQVHTGHGKSLEERQRLIRSSNFLLCVGNWRQSKTAIQEYKHATMLGIPKYEMYYESYIKLEKIIRYLSPVRPIKDTEWDVSKQEDILIFETKEGLLELMDGNHRHEFANRLETVKTLSGWIIKEV